ncbi:MAG: sulfurtransferase TusA family protein [Fidelibacterota bacterium]
MKADFALDALGLLCPLPIIKTAEKMKELKKGQILEVISDDPGIKSDMEAWCRSTSNKLLKIDEDNGEFRVYVKKGL